MSAKLDETLEYKTPENDPECFALIAELQTFIRMRVTLKPHTDPEDVMGALAYELARLIHRFSDESAVEQNLDNTLMGVRANLAMFQSNSKEPH